MDHPPGPPLPSFQDPQRALVRPHLQPLDLPPPLPAARHPHCPRRTPPPGPHHPPRAQRHLDQLPRRRQHGLRGNFAKSDWYANVFSNFGRRPMFAMADNVAHGRRKKALGNVYAKSVLLSSPALAAISHEVVEERLLLRLADLERREEPVEFYDVFLALTIDFIAAYCFGLKAGGNLLSQPETAGTFAKAFKTRERHVSLPQELPRLTRWIGRNGPLPWILPPMAASRTLGWDSEAWLLEMQDRADEVIDLLEKEGKHGNAGNWPTVYAQARRNIHAEQHTAGDKDKDHISPDARLQIASEMKDHIFAGFDTGSVALLFLAWQLSKPENQVWQDELRSEISTLPDSSNARALDGLPILHAIIMETLRLHAPVSGNQVRVSPAKPTLLGIPGQPVVDLPPNTRIHAQAWSLHRNASVFHDPDRWNPGRWLDSSPEQLKEMSRSFFAFSSGARMCIGNNLAMIEMKLVTASIWRTFRTELVDGTGMVHNGGYIGGPLGSDGKYLMLKLKSLEMGA
ncbi:hypothetical protein LTR53_006785 [Teratosphaeriaceae sp. CCFEE 6253]|nr:hypothetical protein LTR53_006785 [Teratosphaeriaceae sp. CCFEE 6253]